MPEERRHPVQCIECDMKFADHSKRLDLLDKEVQHLKDSFTRELEDVHSRRREAYAEFKAHMAKEDGYFTTLLRKLEDHGERIHDVVRDALNERTAMERRFDEKVDELRVEMQTAAKVADAKFVSKSTVAYVWIAIVAAVGGMIWLNNQLQVSASKAQTAAIIRAIKAHSPIDEGG